jgi:hypothetical protein
MGLLPETNQIEEYVKNMSSVEKEQLREKHKKLAEIEERRRERKNNKSKAKKKKATQGIYSQVDKFTKNKARVTHCYSCKHGLDSRKAEKCSKCGWIMCNCGACGCGYENTNVTVI